MGKSGVITEEFRGEENASYHDIVALFKIYRSVNWRMQIKINQVRHRFEIEYGMDVDSFLDSIYQSGMDINQDLAGERERIEAINRSNKFLKMIDEAVELMRKFHPNGERYYWVDYSGSPAHPGRSSAQPDRASAHLIRSAVQLMPVADQHTC